MKSKLTIITIACMLMSLVLANSRVAFSRPGSVLRTPGSPVHEEGKARPLFIAGFSSEIVNFDIPSASTSIYLQTKTKTGFSIGMSYAMLSDPRSKETIALDSLSEYTSPTEISLHLQQRVYAAGNIKIDLGINDITVRNIDGDSEFQNPSIFTVFSSKKDFQKFSIVFNYGFGSGKVGEDKQIINFKEESDSVIKPYLGFNLFTPEIKRLKNKVNFLFEYDGSGINLGVKVPITDEYLISMGIVNFSSMGDFGIRSKVGNESLEIMEKAATVCFGFEMNVPRIKKRSVTIDNPHTNASDLPASRDPEQQILYTSEAVQELNDSLNIIIAETKKNYNTIADSIRFLTFSLENSQIENTSLLQKISTLDDSLSQNQHQKSLDINNFNKATKHISRSLRYYYEQEYQKALIEIDQAIELNPNLAIAYARKGTIYFRIGQTQNASINWNIALKLDPEYDEVRDILEALKNNNLKSADLEEEKEEE